ncbi:SGNH/GDSL hydrolase family protein [Mucilaginibacter terrigena]|uniref:SGNH/GDSL hydrolase family protein n=1 Tax=Mucilaginibacter terrigena TaxID=2492395 RepID=A0A4Q5LHY9_9SPHI|nr:SGNH/GDSL hydrolase family protein [Mucilaginibacter terrigena]RYU87384.1 SGNH/GDSL hydrolase family protein [Mucilaginibacter terrigena]
MRILTIIFLIGTLAACTKAEEKQRQIKITYNNMPIPDSLTYLALGDSYTIGEAVPLEQSFPYQLAHNLNATNHLVEKPDIIAITGWTTGDLKKAIASRDLKNHQYNMVTLLIGVNNQYRGYSKEDYRTEFIELLNTAINYAGGNRQHVFVLSIPDWGVTPYARANGFDPAQVAIEIDQFNAINKQETEKMGVTYVDITPASRRAAYDTGLTAKDGLHPSERMYSLWVSQLLPVVSAQVKY